MKLFPIAIPLIAILATSASCDKGGEQEQPQATISTAPTELAFSAKGETKTIEVTASGAFQAFAGDECKDWIIKVDPSYSAKSPATVSVTTAENLSRKERTGEVIIKVGTTRHKVAVTQESAASNQDGIKCPLDGYSLVWHDEFEGKEVNASNWKFEDWPKGRVNNELQRYVAKGELDGLKTAEVKDGALHITAMKHGSEVISARMNSTQNWLYGYIEAAIWLPKGKGTWPAFWMMPKDQSAGWPKCGEIDIMEEVGVDANQTSSSIHTLSYNHTKGTQKTQARMTKGAESEYHIYALEWTKDYLQFYTDGIATLRFANDGKGNVDTWPFSKPFFVILNLAWGGDWGGYKGVDESALPCTMKIDYVRVFQKD